MRTRGGAARVAVFLIACVAAAGCGISGGHAAASPTSHQVPEAPFGVSHVWIPADYFVLSTVLAVSEDGDALVAFADERDAWKDGITSYGVATVTSDGTVNRLVEPGSLLTANGLPASARLSGSTAAVYVMGGNPWDAEPVPDSYLLVDRRTGRAGFGEADFPGVSGTTEVTAPSIDFALIDDTVVWAQKTSSGLGTIVTMSLDTAPRVQTGNSPVIDGVLALGKDYCTERGFWIYMHNFDALGTNELQVASATLESDGVVSIDDSSVLTAKEGKLWFPQARCGASTVGARAGTGSELPPPLLLVSPEAPDGLALHQGDGVNSALATTADWIAITPRWIVVTTSDYLAGESLTTLVDRVDGTQGTLRTDGPCSLSTPILAGSTLAWAPGARDADPALPVFAACTVAVGTLDSH